MKSILRSLCFLALSSVAFAQSAPSSPPTPTTNAIFIDQIGDSSIVDLTQNGAGNKIGSSVNPFVMHGNDQVLTFTEQGNNNTIQGNIISPTVTSIVSAIGNNDVIDLNMGSAASVTGTNMSLNVAGSSNEFSLTQGGTSSATSAQLTYTISGDFNKFKSSIDTNNVTDSFSVTGDQNNIAVVQNGADFKNINFALVGGGNSFTILQKSTLNVDSLSISSISNNGTFNISQCGPLGC